MINPQQLAQLAQLVRSALAADAPRDAHGGAALPPEWIAVRQSLRETLAPGDAAFDAFVDRVRAELLEVPEASHTPDVPRIALDHAT